MTRSEDEAAKKKKKKDKKGKKSKKDKKKRKRRSVSSGSEEEWVEVTKEGSKRAEGDYGPQLPAEEAEADAAAKRRDYGNNLLPGEGAAMAAYVAEGKRIPRRGEIGVTSEEIETYEKMGYVMSGTRSVPSSLPPPSSTAAASASGSNDFNATAYTHA